MNRGILDLLRNDGSITVNKRLIRELGLIEANVYCELASRYCYFQERERLDSGGYFFNTVEDLERAVNLSRKVQGPVIKALQKAGLIEMKVKGIPATRHFRFTAANLRAVTELLTGIKERTPEELAEELLIKAFADAGATAEPTPEVKAMAAKAIKDGKAKTRARARWG